MGLRPAWALDLTTIDPKDGMPWDSTFESKWKRAIAFLERDGPLLLLVCPMCGGFSAMSNINYGKMGRNNLKKKLRSALAHVKFALGMCLRQYRAGPGASLCWNTPRQHRHGPPP